MSRRRYISTDISLDKRVNELSDFAALLYTWMLPHAEDDGSITADPDELSWTVIPGRRRTSAQISKALCEMFSTGLIIESDGRLFFPCESFYKFQTYIPPAKRRDYDPSSEDQRETPQNTASPSPSPSPSKHMFNARASNVSEFDSFWKMYPRKQDKGHAKKAWAAAIKTATAPEIIRGLELNLPKITDQEPKFIPLAATWLNGERWTDEPEPRPGEKTPNLNARRSRIANAKANLEGGMDADIARGLVGDDLEWQEVVGKVTPMMAGIGAMP